MGRRYLYGIIESTEEAVLGTPGLDGASPVCTVVHQGLGCLVSDYRGRELTDLSKEELLGRLFAHQRVVERFVEEHTLLPVKFGSFLSSRQEVCGLLSQGHTTLVGALGSIQGCVEMEVAATWDIGRTLKEIGKEEEVAGARDAITQGGPVTVEDRIRLGQLVKASMDGRRQRYSEQMVDILKPISTDVAYNVLVSDEMVMNVAFLVERARQQEFHRAVLQLDEVFDHEIDFRLVGPMPPYSFSTVEFTKVTPQQIEEARQALGLEGIASPKEVRGAYRRLAARLQHTLAPGDEMAQTLLNRLREARQFLLGYLDNPVREATNPGEPVFQICIKRSHGEELAHAPSSTGAVASLGIAAGPTGDTGD